MPKNRLTKEALAAAVAARLGTDHTAALRSVDAVIAALADAFKEGFGAELRGFGVWVVRERKAYSGRDPRTGEPVPVPARRHVTFRFTGAL